MRLVTAEEFVRRPVGCAVAGPTFLVWCAAQDFAGTAAWDRPTESDANAIARVWEFHHALPAGYDLVADFGELTAVDSRAFAIVAAAEETRRTLYPHRVRRHALVRPRGMAGAVVAGFFAHLGMEHTWANFIDAPAAFAWFERPDAGPVRARVEELVATAKPSPLVVSLRAWLDQNVAAAELPRAGRALGASTRTLQRALAAAGTSFRAELLEARLRLAQLRLAESADKIDVVARQVGFATASRLARAIRERTGMTPQAFRNASKVHRDDE